MYVVQALSSAMVKHRLILQQQMHAKASMTSDQLAASTLELCRLLKVRTGLLLVMMQWCC